MRQPYFQTPQRIEKFDKALQEWVGTPFVPYIGKKKVGADCVRFAASSMQELGAVSSVNWPQYAIRGSQKGFFDVLCKTVEEVKEIDLVWKSDEKEASIPFHLLLTGDILVFSTGRAVQHMGVYAGSNQFYHCVNRYGVMFSCLSDSTYSKILKRVYRVMEEL